MQYALLIYGDETVWAGYSDAQRGVIYQEFGALRESMLKNGQFVGGHQLHPTSMATTVRVRDGKRAVTDGPFAETKEQLGGVMLIEAKDLDEAMSIAERIPLSRSGAIEVRPIVVRGEATAAR